MYIYSIFCFKIARTEQYGKTKHLTAVYKGVDGNSRDSEELIVDDFGNKLDIIPLISIT